jgi:hypothetical protein
MNTTEFVLKQVSVKAECGRRREFGYGMAADYL